MFRKVIYKSHVTWLNNYVRTLLDLLAGLGQLMMTLLTSLNITWVLICSNNSNCPLNLSLTLDWVLTFLRLLKFIFEEIGFLIRSVKFLSREQVCVNLWSCLDLWI